MSYLSGSVYGTDKYGSAYYGQPTLTGGTVFPTFSVEPLIGKALDYNRVQVTWTIPTNGTSLRLVRNTFSLPSDPNDGVVLDVVGPTAIPLYVDALFGSEQRSAFFYYSMWNQDGSGTWWRAGDAQVMFPGLWGYGEKLFNLLPEYLRVQDSQIES